MNLRRSRTVAVLAMLAASLTHAAPYVIDVDPKGASMQIFPGGAHVTSLPTTLQISISNSNAGYKITRVDHVSSSLLTPWMPDGASAQPILNWKAILEGLPPEQWYGKFKVTFQPVQKGGNGNGKGGAAPEPIVITALVTGESDGELMMRPTDKIVCKDTPHLTYETWVVKSDGTEVDAPCDWEVTENGAGPPVLDSAGNTSSFDATVSGTLPPAPGTPSNPTSGIYDVTATLVTCPGAARPNVSTTLEVVDLVEIQVYGQTAAPYVVCCGKSLDLTAVCSGSDFPSGLPTWSSTPAGVSFVPSNGPSVQATFPDSLCGQTVTIEATACGTTKSIEVYVIDLDLSYAGLPEEDSSPPNEESPGGILCVNDNDNDGIVGVDSSRTLPLSSADPELAPITLSFPNLPPAGIASLSLPDALARIWASDTKQPLPATASGLQWDLADSAQRSDFIANVLGTRYLEAIAASSAEGDVVVTFEYQRGSVACNDVVKITNLGVHVTSLTPASDLPLGDDLTVDYELLGPSGYGFSSVDLQIINRNDVTIFEANGLPTAIGMHSTNWQKAQWNQSPHSGAFANPNNGPYLAKIVAAKGSHVCEGAKNVYTKFVIGADIADVAGGAASRAAGLDDLDAAVEVIVSQGTTAHAVPAASVTFSNIPFGKALAADDVLLNSLADGTWTIQLKDVRDEIGNFYDADASTNTIDHDEWSIDLH